MSKFYVGQRVRPSANPEDLSNFEAPAGVGTITEIGPDNGDDYSVRWDLSDWDKTYQEHSLREIEEAGK